MSTLIYTPTDTVPNVPGYFSQYMKQYKGGETHPKRTYFPTRQVPNITLLSISNLPPNHIVQVSLMGEYYGFRTDNNGVLYFSHDKQPLPLYLLIYAEVCIITDTCQPIGNYLILSPESTLSLDQPIHIEYNVVNYYDDLSSTKTFRIHKGFIGCLSPC